MPRADGPNNATKEDVQQITNTDLTDEELGPEQDDITGNGASGEFGLRDKSGSIKAGDTEKSGAKAPDAMGAGQIKNAT